MGRLAQSVFCGTLILSVLLNKRFHDQVSLRNTASLILHSVHPQIHRLCKHIKGFQMSDSKETCLIIEPFYHIISAENILEKTGLGNNHDKKVIRFLEALNPFPDFFFICCLFPFSYHQQNGALKGKEAECPIGATKITVR